MLIRPQRSDGVPREHLSKMSTDVDRSNSDDHHRFILLDVGKTVDGVVGKGALEGLALVKRELPDASEGDAFVQFRRGSNGATPMVGSSASTVVRKVARKQANSPDFLLASTVNSSATGPRLDVLFGDVMADRRFVPGDDSLRMSTKEFVSQNFFSVRSGTTAIAGDGEKSSGRASSLLNASNPFAVTVPCLHTSNQPPTKSPAQVHPCSSQQGLSSTISNASLSADKQGTFVDWDEHEEDCSSGETRSNRAVTSNRPTLVPRTPLILNRDNVVARTSGHTFQNQSDLLVNANLLRPSFASIHHESAQPSSTYSPVLPRENDLASYNSLIDNTSIGTTIPQQQEVELNIRSTFEALSSDTMGYCTTSGQFESEASALGSRVHGSTAEAATAAALDKMDDKVEALSASSIAGTGDFLEESRTFQQRHDRDDDDTTIRTADSVTINSPVLTPLHTSTVPEANSLATGPMSSYLGTPSTVSTAPSTDEASLGMDPHPIMERVMRAEMNYAEALNRSHSAVAGWESSPHQAYHNAFGSGFEFDHGVQNAVLPPAYVPHQMQQQQQHSNSAWGQPITGQLVASFRPEQQVFHHPHHAQQLGNHAERRWPQQHHAPQMQHIQATQQNPYYSAAARHGLVAADGRTFRPTQQQQVSLSQYQQMSQQQAQRRPPSTYGPSSMQSGNTPTRPMGRGQRTPTTGQNPHHSQPTGGSGGVTAHGHAGVGGSRSPSEVLKTLLRKKACLYEPDTSRAVALVTWLVGRTLALESGFFSRQQLQAGVHACVADMIHSGVITRTKVNRCMQIILNSCFHYIIPRPDGTEENGDGFRDVFSLEVKDDFFLLKVLPAPWKDMVVDRDVVLEAASMEVDTKPSKKPGLLSTPQASPSLTSTPTPEKLSPNMELNDEEDSDAKRAVLLCFNENVRSGEDVFRCHNEFIRDTAHASNLQLSSHEWRLFFGKEAASAPFLWGNIGIPVPSSDGYAAGQVDALGFLTIDELNAFRTTWCSKRYDHDHELCGFAHVEVNGGWLRRNPLIHRYRDEMCPSISSVSSGRGNSNILFINECAYGVNCSHAHTAEEIAYHPKRYKAKPCNSIGRQAGCHLGDVCPCFHPAEVYRFPKKAEGRSPRHHRQTHQGNKVTAGMQMPASAPVLYASPAPVSSFENFLLLPGLKELYRRNCSVTRAHLRLESASSARLYSCFGDDTGIVDSDTGRSSKPQNGLIRTIRS